MLNTIRCFLFTVLVFYSLGDVAHGQIARYAFRGRVQSALPNIPGYCGTLVLGTEVCSGDRIFGWFELDEDVEVFNSKPGRYNRFPNEKTGRYLIFVNGRVFSNDGNFGVTVTNDYKFMDFPPASDGFGLVEGCPDVPQIPPFAGTTYLVDGKPLDWGRVLVDVIDLDATSFNSGDLPKEINFSDFELMRFSFNGGAEGFNDFSLQGVLTSFFRISILPGDVNCDGEVDLLDVATFVEALIGHTYEVKADMNFDESVDLLDVAPFVELLTAN